MRPAEWRLYRDARLRALAGAPEAFGTTYAESAALTDEQWEQQFRERAATMTHYLAFGGSGAVAGIVRLFGQPGEPDVVEVLGMWVEPEHRRLGAARALLDTCLEEARRRKAERVRLEVVEGNDAAIRLYERYGFVFTGAWEPLREGSPQRGLEMEKVLG